MSVDTQAEVPALRFSEFEGAWEDTKAGSAFSNRRDRGEAGLPMYSVTLHRGLVRRDSLERHIAADAADDANLRVQPNDLVYNMMRMWQGAVGRATVECMVSPAYVVLSPNERTSPDFFDQWFQAARSLYLLWAYSQGITSDRLRLYFRDFAQIPIRLPSPTEQKRIAAFLGAVDEKKNALRRKRDLLTDYKRGIMQKIFSQKIRFTRDDYTTYPDWEEKRLGEIGQTFGGLSGKSSEEFGTGKPYVTYKQVFDSAFIDLKKCGRVSVSANESQNLVKLGDVLFTVSSETASEIGFASVLLHEVDELYLNSFCFGFRPHKTDCFLPSFARYFFHGPHYRKAVYPLAQGSTRFNISKTNFLKLLLLVPHPDEQRKIADFLESLDTKIDTVADQITQIEAFKNGLLQQMFV